MTNAEKYKTAQDRSEAMLQWCNERWCEKCVLHEHGIKSVDCAFHWLDLESEEEKPLPCIWCKHDTYVCVGQNYGQVRCKNCMAEGPATDSKEHAIRNYNRVAKAVKESEVKE